jgi:BMFP domain-containing protein YqiC
MLDDMRKYVRAGLEALSSQDAEVVAAALRSRAQGLAEQLSGLAAGFVEWSSEARASLLREVRDLVARQVEEMGLASREELGKLESRVERLEAGTGKSVTKRSTSKRSSTRSASKRSTSKRSIAGRAGSSPSPKVRATRRSGGSQART